jgi:hypothetical protein
MEKDDGACSVNRPVEVSVAGIEECAHQMTGVPHATREEPETGDAHVRPSRTGNPATDQTNKGFAVLTEEMEMANMSYCRFRNTLDDLRDCHEHMDDELSESEQKDRKRLIKLCCEIAGDYEDLIEP